MPPVWVVFFKIIRGFGIIELVQLIMKRVKYSRFECNAWRARLLSKNVLRRTMRVACTMSLLFFSSGGVLEAAESGSAPFELVSEHAAKSVIILQKKASLSEKRAAEELQTYIKKATGADVPIQSSDELSSPIYPIYLGTPPSSAIEKFGLSKKVEELSDEGFIIKADKQGLVIAAKKPIGVLYGAYTFLEHELGVRWLMPGESGEFIPKSASLRISPLESVQNPAFTVRTMTHSCTNFNERLTDTWDWMVRNKMSVKVGYNGFWNGKKNAEEMEAIGATVESGGHILASFVPDSLFEAHPEYFALVDGQRRKGGHSVDEHGKVYQRCTSNPAVIDLSAQYIIDSFRENKGSDAFLIGNNDGNGWCECDACVALDDPWEREHGIVSTRFYKFINTVAEKVWKELPGKEIRGWGYQVYRTAPRGVEPDPRLEIFVAMHGRCYRHGMDDPSCPTNEKLCEVLKDWKKSKGTIGLREYYSCFIGGSQAAFLPYIPLEDIVAEDIKYAAKIGLKVWDDETPPPDGAFGSIWNTEEIRESWRARYPMYYIAAKLLWDPNLDAEKLKDEAFALYFGPAGDAMKSYRRLLSKAWMETPGHFTYGTSSTSIGQSLVKVGLEKQLLEALDKAEQAAGNDSTAKERVIQERKFFEATWQAMARQLEKSTAWHDVNALERSGNSGAAGMPSDEEWEKVPTTTGFSGHDGKLAEVQTFSQILYDKDAIYFRLTMMEPTPALMKTRFEKRDDNLWDDNCIELFLDPEKSAGQFYHFIVNPKGAIYDSNVIGSEDKSYNSDCTANVKTLDDRWIAELKIPLSSLNTKIDKGDSWKVNIGRNRNTGDRAENSSWTDGGFSQPSSFRTVVFGSEPAALENGGFEVLKELQNEDEKASFLQGWTSGNNPVVRPEGWSMHDAHTGVVTVTDSGAHSGKHALEVQDGWFHQVFAAETDDELQVEFWVKGEGNVQVMLFQYGVDSSGQMQSIPTATLGTVQLDGEWTKSSFDYTIVEPGVKKVALAFAVQGTLILDDVTVKKSKP